MKYIHKQQLSQTPNNDANHIYKMLSAHSQAKFELPSSTTVRKVQNIARIVKCFQLVFPSQGDKDNQYTLLYDVLYACSTYFRSHTKSIYNASN